MPDVFLSESQVDTLAEACQVAVEEHLRFLDDDMRMVLAQALLEMNRPEAAKSLLGTAARNSR